ncbi:MAG: DUF983 domain-containing protein [Pseudolabrys sp.]|nr:DUF983 domain-containing protein [Pseudolabrys sp.]
MPVEFRHAAAPAQTALPATAGQALWRGFRGKCPACGEGPLFGKFLKVNDACPHCHEEMHHHRADDFPAYLVIIIVGHILVPLVLAVETHIAPPVLLSMLLWPAIALVSTLGLLQPVKGAVVAVQWFGGMHGFEDAKKARAPTPLR